MATAKAISLLEVIRERGAEMALVASYNVYFPFFERVVLPRLRSAGCGYVVLMMDAGQLSAVAQDPGARPMLAGREYGLLPIAAPGAFHPKFYLFIGKQRSRLLVGSHNLTLSGFGLNMEITTLFEATTEERSRQPFQVTWRFGKEWASDLHRRNLDLLLPFERFAPWLGEEPETPTEDEPVILGSHRVGSSLWEQLQPHLASKASSVTVLGPSFDSRLEFLRTLERDIEAARLVVAVDPDESSIPADAASRFPKVRFVDISKTGWKGSHPRLHAKVLRFGFPSGKEVLVSGSANPSRQAWTAPAGQRNAELVVVQKLSKGESLPTQLRLHKLAELPAVSKARWKEVAARLVEEAQPQPDEGQSAEIAIACEDGFLVPRSFVARVTPTQVQLISIDERLSRPDGLAIRSDDVLVRVRDRALRDSIVRLEVPRSAVSAATGN
jgi:hypothetical protein